MNSGKDSISAEEVALVEKDPLAGGKEVSIELSEGKQLNAAQDGESAQKEVAEQLRLAENTFGDLATVLSSSNTGIAAGFSALLLLIALAAIFFTVTLAQS